MAPPAAAAAAAAGGPGGLGINLPFLGRALQALRAGNPAWAQFITVDYDPDDGEYSDGEDDSELPQCPECDPAADPAPAAPAFDRREFALAADNASIEVAEVARVNPLFDAGDDDDDDATPTAFPTGGESPDPAELVPRSPFALGDGPMFMPGEPTSPVYDDVYDERVLASSLDRQLLEAHRRHGAIRRRRRSSG